MFVDSHRSESHDIVTNGVTVTTTYSTILPNIKYEYCRGDRYGLLFFHDAHQ